MSKPTPAQQAAIDARGDVLVVAGAGAGKTRTLVERCMAWLLEDPQAHSLDQILMVTFTEAAAAEMRKRLRDRLEKVADTVHGCAEQLALLDTAHICTLHSFCLRLVRQHFFELGVDPQMTVLADDQSRMLARQAMDAILDEQYRGETPLAAMVQDLIQDHGRGWDQPVRDLIHKIHQYTQTLPDPEAWFADQFAYLNQVEPVRWREWLLKELERWKSAWLAYLLPLETSNPNAAQCVRALRQIPAQPSREQFAEALAAILASDQKWPTGKKQVLREPLEDFLEEAGFLESVCTVNSSDPLAEDWGWVRPQMLALLQMTQQFEETFARAKREMGGVDFQDLEQFAFRLLWNKQANKPTSIAEHWRKRFQLIFVDEYQDINAVQDAIIKAVGGDGVEANRFLVGDVKQSIYRFRLADPKIFLRYQGLWPTADHAQVISLSENFRSHENILQFVNELFGVLMHREAGGITYDEAARLQFGNREGRAALTKQPGASPCVEMHVRLPAPAKADAAPVTDAELEAQLIATRLKELKQQPFTVHEGSETRPVTWNDMVILLRSPRGKVEAYVKEFHRLGVPLSAVRGGFYESLEIKDLMALLQLLDNPLQDYPLLAVLRSPIAGLSLDDLARIRLAERHGRFWTALVRWHQLEGARDAATELQSDQRALYCRVDLFLKRFAKWRRGTRHLSLSHCLEMVLNETHYLEWLLTQDRGEQRRANVERLLQLTRQFDIFQREGLFRFLKYVETQEDIGADVEPAGAPAGDAVRLMSIHQSKGLEFPVVVLADLGKEFNSSDLHGRIIMDEELGLCPKVKPPQARQFYPSLPFWMAQRRHRVEALGEELRLLYVAVTRAAQHLVLVGTASSKNALVRWQKAVDLGLGVQQVLAANNFLEWLGAWLVKHNGPMELREKGSTDLVSWIVHEEPVVANAEAVTTDNPKLASAIPSESELAQLRARLEWQYPKLGSTTRPAKASVTSLRREIADEEAEPLFEKPRFPRAVVKTPGKLTAAEIGSAHHAFLEMVSLESVGSISELKLEADRLHKEQRLSSEELESLNFDALAGFWASEVGKAFLCQLPQVRRELAFTARFGKEDFDGLGQAGVELEGEFVIVQGVIDLAVILPQEIWVLDFKTDHILGGQVQEKIAIYRPQLELYSRAISRIYSRPVTRSWLYFLAVSETVAIRGIK